MLRSSLEPILDVRVRAAWQTQIAHAAKTTGLMKELVQRRRELLPRFAACYAQLRALPRRTRRMLQRKLSASLAGVALLFTVGHGTADAAVISVGPGCNLIDAIKAANTDLAVGLCAAGSGADTIILPANNTLTLTAVDNSTLGPTGLPIVSSTITIEGNGSTIKRDSAAPAFRILAVGSSGNLTLKNATVSGGFTPEALVSHSGAGISNAGLLTILNSSVSGNSGNAFGGGVVNSSGATLTIDNSTISGNSAKFGGGILNDGVVTVLNTTVSKNTADHVGGVSNDGGTATITNSLITENTATSTGGGGIGNNSGGFGGSILTVTNSVISKNTGRSAGGISNNPFDTASILNSVVSDNTSVDSGGGVSSAGILTIQDSTISDNTAGGHGGGIITHFSSASGNTATIMNSVITGNLANLTSGGIWGDGSFTVTECLISNNSAKQEGGGIRGVETLIINNSTISNNFAAQEGGGVLSGGSTTIIDSTIFGNTSEQYGGGIYHDDSATTLTISNSTISGNSASDAGGGVFNFSTLTLLNSTITDNSAGDKGGGIRNRSSGGAVTLNHVLVSGNSAPTGPEIHNSGSVTGDDFNIVGMNGTAGVVGFVPGVTDIVPAVPLSDIFTPLANNGGPTPTHLLVPGSPAINAVGGGCPPPSEDQRGLTRPQGAVCDIGAVEVGDFDSDGIADNLDNCPGAANLNQKDTNGDGIGDVCSYDLAVTKISAPKKVNLTTAKPEQTKTIRVQIQNQSSQVETIPHAGTLAAMLGLTVEALDTPADCPDVAAAIVTDNFSFPLTIKAKAKLTVPFSVTFTPDCIPDPVGLSRSNPGHEDYRLSATVNHLLLDGKLDTDPTDDTLVSSTLIDVVDKR